MTLDWVEFCRQARTASTGFNTTLLTCSSYGPVLTPAIPLLYDLIALSDNYFVGAPLGDHLTAISTTSDGTYLANRFPYCSI